MRHSTIAIWFSALLGIVAAALFFGCGASQTNYSYGGPGSSYSAALNADGTFTITRAADINSAASLTVAGTYSRLSTGFVYMTVTAVTGTGPSVGDTAYGMEIPGFAFLVKPVGGDSHVIPMVASGTCPTADFTANWIAGDKDDSTSATNIAADFFGTFSYNATANTATLPAKYALAGPFTALGAGTVPGLGTCSSGVLSFTGGAMWLTSLGGALVHANTGGETADQIIIAMPATSLASTTSLAGNYAGLVFNKDLPTGDANRLFPVSVTATAPTSTTMSMTGTQLTDVTTGATGAGTATLAITAMNSPSAGFMTGTVTVGASNGLMVCSAAVNAVSSGKNFINCVAQSPDDNTQMFNLLMVSK